MRILFLIITFTYLLLEAITATQASALFFSKTTLDDLLHTEKLGYITAGFGVALLMSTQKRWWTPLLFVGAFITTSHGLHWIIDRAPQVFTAQMKQVGVYYGIGILTTPSPRWIASAYHVAPAQTFRQQTIIDFVHAYGNTDEQNRQMMAAGIRGIGLFSKQWDLTVQKLDRESLSSRFQQLHRGIYEAHFVKRDKKAEKPFPLLLTFAQMKSIDPAADYALSLSRNWTAHEAAWWAMRQQFDFLPIKAPRFDRWADIFNKELTRTALMNYLPNLDGERMPWLGQPAYTHLYQKVCAEIAPFLFSQGRPLLNLASLREQSVRELYINELKNPLSTKLSTAMQRYQLDNFNQLIQSPQAWENPVRAAAGLGLTRLVWLTPWMTILSWALLLANAWRFSTWLTKCIPSGLQPPPMLSRAALGFATIVLVLFCAHFVLSSDIWGNLIEPWILMLGPQPAPVRII